MPPAINLQITDLHGRVREFTAPGPSLQVGSHPSCGLVLSGRGVADHHCVLELDEHRELHLRACDPHAATYIDHEQLNAPCVVARGKRIYIGEYQLDHLAQAAAPARAYVAPRAAPPSVLRTHAPYLALAGATVALTAALLSWPSAPEPTPLPAPQHEPPLIPTSDPPRPVAPPPERRGVTVRHEVIPGELLDDIAVRYHVSVPHLLADNGPYPDSGPPPGTVLTFKAHDPPLPKLRLVHKVEPGDTWTGLSERFELGVELLHRYNPTLHGELIPDSDFIVWVDPQVERPSGDPLSRRFLAAPGALSVGAPSAGTLERGIQLPEHSGLYQRIFPQYQYGSSHTIEHLQTAIAAFRQRYRYPGVLVVSNLSRLDGGPFHPHRSHQSGRDVDIWLPALKGTYQRKHLNTDRKPRTAEINWFAAWGLVDALLATDQVNYIFLDSTLLPELYAAAEILGASPERLAQIQWQPDSARSTLAQRARAPVRHAADHTGHIHVRFKCGRNETLCRERPEVEEP